MGQIRIAYYLHSLNIGGAETFITNVMECIDREAFKIDFILQSDQNDNKVLLELLNECSSEIHYVTPFYKNYCKSINDIRKVLKNGRYNIIHVHQNALINVAPIVAAKLENVKIAVHSHNTKNNAGGFVGTTLHRINTMWLSRQDIVRFACGVEAGEWMFGKKKFEVLNNAINLGKFTYSEKQRDEIRQEFNIKGVFIIGHIGRFVPAKNHTFLVDIFDSIQKKEPNAYLLLVGDGDTFKETKQKCEQLGLMDKVKFVGLVTNPVPYYSALDCMVFPSIFEGLPFTLIEAQASGLKVITSTNVTRDANVTGDIDYISLSESPEYWADKVLEARQDRDRVAVGKLMVGSKYDSNAETKRIECAYKSICGVQE